MELEANTSVLVPQVERPKSDWLLSPLALELLSRQKGPTWPIVF
jgi:hypothetical protein